MHIVAISGSLRANSTNTKLIRAAVALAPADTTATLYAGLDALPHFSPERDTDPPPVAVASLRALLQTANAVLICTPEYAFGIPGALKNALDWMVSSGSLNGKPVAAIAASPLYSGGINAHASLLLTLSALGANVLEGVKLTIPAVNAKLNADGAITDPGLTLSLRAMMKALVQTATP
ncbi:MAG: NAD(P)H-dependent oxidoreductase [Bacteroidetes bacterium]|nr:NAD(P)H-dependent oxidoreductase [Fibrella sp.]